MRTSRVWPAVVLLALVVAACSARNRALSGALELAAVEITVAALVPPLRALSDDRFEGRGPGTRGDLLTRRYLAGQMKRIGLLPGVERDSFEQPVALVGLTPTLPESWTFTSASSSVSLAAVEDFVASSRTQAARAALTDSEVVFVGYGIQAPEYDWDDFKGADLRGKTLLIMNNDPDWDTQLFAGKRRLYYGRWTYKYESAARQGAAGAIVIHTDESASYPWQTVQTSWSGENSHLPGASEPAPTIEAWVTDEAAATIVGLGGHSLDDLRRRARKRAFEPVPLGVTTSFALAQNVRHYASANVIGVLPGSDPDLAKEAIIYTAHHDHLGIKADADGTTVVYNGALDNAAGVAQMLAVARAFAAAPRPRRSVVFIALAAEEQGLLGSKHYVANPTVAVSRMVANINFDGANIWGRTRDVAVVGYGKSTVDEWAAAAAAEQDRVLVDERFPERGSFYRSDQLSFARAGVPVLYARGGTDFIGRPPEWGRDQVDAWIQQHYHQPSDDYSEDWDLEGAVEDAQLAFAVGYGLAMSEEMPQWLPGDEFEAARTQSPTP